MCEVKRVFPGPVNGLINWMEQNFNDIEEFVVQFQMKDGTSMMIYDTYSFRNALGMLEMAKGSCHELAINDEFTPKGRDGNDI